jgi:predicted N-acyltransferase
MRINISTSISDIDPAAWDALDAGGSPFLRHAFLSTLETTQCVGPETGWLPAPITLNDAGGLAAAALAYVKGHSYGEFVFDFAWARAYAQHGLQYYPKLTLAVPFTPVSGARLLVRPDVDAAAARAALIDSVRQVAETRGLSSVHALFVGEEDRAAFEAAGWLARRDVQFHWVNGGYRDFEHYLESFTAGKRKKAKRERRRVAEEGIHFETLHGGDIPAQAIDEVFDLHRDTFLRNGGEPYLTRRCFRELPRALVNDFIVKRARRGNETLAAAVFLRGGNALYGRYWGAYEQHHSLHFETCYHQGIEYCIEHGIERFESGAQGEHKVSRGFAPATTWSMHWIVDPRFRDAIGDYLRREGEDREDYAHYIAAHVPYREARRDARTKRPR